MSEKLQVIVLASGRGSNFKAVLDAIDSGQLKGCQISGLITDRLHTGAAVVARQAGIAVFELDYQSYSARSAFETELQQVLAEHSPDYILALGFMRILPPELVRRYRRRIVNIHPSLLPAFKGMHAQKQAFDYGVKISGCTVHLIDEGVDTGPILDQQAVDIRQARSADEAAALILKAEHPLLIRALQQLTRSPRTAGTTH
ncbi:MAG: phosphoribosylglycinamide formyltransferase [Leptospiraceae bacterium]|nr:phosphoribosylglycinamide formyltransferase [Leptospiraceae bacterium]